MILSCDPKESHAGDLGNIATPILGDTNIDLVDTLLTLGDGGERWVLTFYCSDRVFSRDIAGRAIVIHAGSDDLGT